MTNQCALYIWIISKMGRRKKISWELHQDERLSNNQIDKFFKMLCVLLILIPRSGASYVGYTLAGFIIYRWHADFLIRTFLLSSLFLLSICIASFVHDISWTAFAIEFLLLFPMAAFCFGSSVRNFGIRSFRLISLVLFVTSMLSLIEMGFPFKLPYRDFLPDAYWGPYGLGGARWVTIIAFGCIIAELLTRSKSYSWLVLAIINFTMPSYLIGFLAGLIALAIILLRNPLIWLFFLLIFLGSFSYILDRYAGLNTQFVADYGLHPKIYSFLLVVDVFSDFPELLLSGIGLGQYTSTAAIWSNELTRLYSANQIPDLPGFFPSSIQESYLNNLYLLAEDSKWLFSSSFNKPYFSFVTILSELGFFGLVLIGLFFKRLLDLRVPKRFRLGIIIFTSVIFLLDNWHDNPVFFVTLVLLEGMCRSEKLGDSNAP